MRILVTGARGLLGTPLAERLAGAHETVPLDRAELDVTNAAAVAATLARVRPDRVAHLAAWTDVDGCELDPARAERVNGEGTRAVAAACAELGVPLLYVSTDYVFDGAKEGAWVEDDSTGPLSVYGRSKLHGEAHVRALVPTWWIVRCQSIYGRGRRSFVEAVLARARTGETLRVVDDQTVCPSLADDLAPALEAVLLRAPPGIYHAANAGACTWYDCAVTALRLAGLEDVPVTRIRASDLARPAPRPRNSAFDCSRLAEAAGVRLRPWEDALAAYVAGTASGEEAAA